MIKKKQFNIYNNHKNFPNHLKIYQHTPKKPTDREFPTHEPNHQTTHAHTKPTHKKRTNNHLDSAGSDSWASSSTRRGSWRAPAAAPWAPGTCGARARRRRWGPSGAAPTRRPARGPGAPTPRRPRAAAAGTSPHGRKLRLRPSDTYRAGCNKTP